MPFDPTLALPALGSLSPAEARSVMAFIEPAAAQAESQPDSQPAAVQRESQPAAAQAESQPHSQPDSQPDTTVVELTETEASAVLQMLGVQPDDSQPDASIDVSIEISLLAGFITQKLFVLSFIQC